VVKIGLSELVEILAALNQARLDWAEYFFSYFDYSCLVWSTLES